MTNLEASIESAFKYFKDKPVLQKNSKGFILEGSLHCYVKGYEDMYDVFNVAITIPLNFPWQLPTVVEKDCKIKRTVEYHMDKNGVCCLGTKIALLDYMHSNKIETFCQFLEQIIIIHFFQVKHFLTKGEWLEKPEGHYTPGLIDSYKRIFNMTENELKKTLSKKFKRYSKCLCKSNRRFDKCHGRYIPVEQIQRDFQEMIGHYKKH